MTIEENIKSILNTCFTGFREDIIDIAVYRIMETIERPQSKWTDRKVDNDKTN